LPSQEDRVFFAAMIFGILRVPQFLRRICPHCKLNQPAGDSARNEAPLARTFFTHLTHLTYLTLVSLLPLVSRAQNDEFRFHSLGARVGFPAENTSNHFRQAEAFLTYNLWRWELSTDWRLQSRVDLSGGWLGEHGDNAFVGTLGPTLELSRVRFPLSLEGGASPTYISRHHFGSTDLGSRVQFTSHIGLNWDVMSHWQLGYRFEHMSNGGISHPNPGFNVHVVSIAYLL
jgi:hypothetical protein